MEQRDCLQEIPDKKMESEVNKFEDTVDDSSFSSKEDIASEQHIGVLQSKYSFIKYFYVLKKKHVESGAND